jgi:hypothetical protein
MKSCIADALELWGNPEVTKLIRWAVQSDKADCLLIVENIIAIKLN